MFANMFPHMNLQNNRNVQCKLFNDVTVNTAVAMLKDNNMVM